MFIQMLVENRTVLEEESFKLPENGTMGRVNGTRSINIHKTIEWIFPPLEDYEENTESDRLTYLFPFGDETDERIGYIMNYEQDANSDTTKNIVLHCFFRDVKTVVAEIDCRGDIDNEEDHCMTPFILCQRPVNKCKVEICPAFNSTVAYSFKNIFNQGNIHPVKFLIINVCLACPKFRTSIGNTDRKLFGISKINDLHWKYGKYLFKKSMKFFDSYMDLVDIPFVESGTVILEKKYFGNIGETVYSLTSVEGTIHDYGIIIPANNNNNNDENNNQNNNNNQMNLMDDEEDEGENDDEDEDILELDDDDDDGGDRIRDFINDGDGDDQEQQQNEEDEEDRKMYNFIIHASQDLDYVGKLLSRTVGPNIHLIIHTSFGTSDERVELISKVNDYFVNSINVCSRTRRIISQSDGLLEANVNECEEMMRTLSFRRHDGGLEEFTLENYTEYLFLKNFSKSMDIHVMVVYMILIYNYRFPSLKIYKHIRNDWFNKFEGDSSEDESDSSDSSGVS